LEKGQLPEDIYESIRNRWREVAGANWVGKV
ncbi:aldo/keto reductase, partial [Clostridium perfringens]|nr:aldo/keto reductase [Clostridium perfringens]